MQVCEHNTHSKRIFTPCTPCRQTHTLALTLSRTLMHTYMRPPVHASKLIEPTSLTGKPREQQACIVLAGLGWSCVCKRSSQFAVVASGREGTVRGGKGCCRVCTAETLFRGAAGLGDLFLIFWFSLNFNRNGVCTRVRVCL